jgi:hypothetical protein
MMDFQCNMHGATSKSFFDYVPEDSTNTAPISSNPTGHHRLNFRPSLCSNLAEHVSTKLSAVFIVWLFACGAD